VLKALTAGCCCQRSENISGRRQEFPESARKIALQASRYFHGWNLFPRRRFATLSSIRNSLPHFGHSRLASRITSIGELNISAVRQYGQTIRCSWNTSLVARFTEPIFYSRFTGPGMNRFPHLGHSRWSQSTRLQSANGILESQCGQVVICNSLILSQLSLRRLGILRVYCRAHDADVPGRRIRTPKAVNKRKQYSHSDICSLANPQRLRQKMTGFGWNFLGGPGFSSVWTALNMQQN